MRKTPLHRRKNSILLSAILISKFASAANVTWDGSESSDWDNGLNWDNTTGPIAGDVAFINSGTIDFTGIPNENLRALRVLGGTLNLSGGELKATSQSSWDSHVEGTINHTGSDAYFNELEIGRTSGDTSFYFLSGGSLVVSRALGGYSLHVGANKSSVNAGTGNFEISGGSLTTRSGVKLGDATLSGTGNFAVLGSAPSEIGIGAANDDNDATWVQHSGSTLEVGVDPNGVSTIVVHDSSTDATGTSATFENGSLLDVDYYTANGGGGTWTVLEVQNGDIIDNGLAFAPGVNTNAWSFSIDNSGSNGLLKVTSSDPVNRDVFWDGSESTAWEEPLNWTNNFGPYTASYIHIDSGTVNFTSSSNANYNLRGFRMTGGTLNISGGDLTATNLASAQSNLDGITNQTNGNVEINALEIGRTTTSNAKYTLSNGSLKINRGASGYSLFLGSNRNDSNSGNGTFEISGGEFTTRVGVKLGDNTSTGTGKFTVLGSSATEIGIARANNDSDGEWLQHAGSTLEVGIDFGGVTTIFLEDSDSNTTGTSAIFENGSLLDVDYYNLTEGGGTWTVMEVENGNITDNGLAFARGVDTSIWSFTIDNSGSNGRLLVTALGDPLGHALTIGSTLQQKMRYGMDYERLWYWTNGLSGAERDDVARWSAVDTDIDFIRVAMNSSYELVENTYNLSAYTSKIVPLMQEMQQANPDIKFFASPRPLNESYSSSNPEFDGVSNKNAIRWQPYPLWITGAPSYTSGSFDFDDIKCSEYLVRYLLLMKSYGFKISFLDVSNEWQSNGFGGRLTQDDMDDIHEYLNVTYFNAPWSYSGVGNNLFLDPEDIPEIVAPSAWSYSQSESWISNLDSGDKEAISIAAAHNTDRGGSAASFAADVKAELGSDVEIWNTEMHGWKSTSSKNETTSFYYYLEAIRGGFGGINGWLAIGTTAQGHAYILNPNGTPTRNVKYHIFQKLSSTSNYGHALDIIEEPTEPGAAGEVGVLRAALNYTPSGNSPETSVDDNAPRNIAAFIKGNLMTVWIVNENPTAVPFVITPDGHTIGESTVRRTRWTDPSDVEGFETFETVNSNNSFASTIPGESVCCFEIVLSSENFATTRIEAEDFSHQWGTQAESTEDVDGNENLGFISDGDWTRYSAVALTGNSKMSFRVARPNGRPDSLIQIREGSAGGNLLGEIAVPVTGAWQTYQTIETTLNVDAGIYNLYLVFEEDAATPTNNSFVNFNWFSVNGTVAIPITGLTATASGETEIALTWDSVSDAPTYDIKRSTSAIGPFTTISSNLTGTSFSDSDLTPVTTYYYVVVGNFDGANGPDSAIANATTEAEPIVIEDLVISSLDFGYDGLNNEQLSFTIEKSGLGQSYQIYTSESLTTNDWTPLGPIYQGTGGLLEIDVLFDYSSVVNEKKFFRIANWIE